MELELEDTEVALLLVLLDTNIGHKQHKPFTDYERDLLAGLFAKLNRYLLEEIESIDKTVK